MPVPQTVVLDDFNRTNEGPPPSSSWTAFTAAAGGLTVSSNQAAATSGDGAAYWNVEEFGPDSEAYVAVPVADSAPSPDEIWLYLRLVDIGSGTTDGYAMQTVDVAEGTDHRRNLNISVYRLDNDVQTALGSGAGVSFTYMTELAFSVQGANLLATVLGDGDYSGWTDVYLVSDLTYSTAGSIGLRLKDNSGTLRADDFGGGRVLDLSIDRSGGLVIVGPS